MTVGGNSLFDEVDFCCPPVRLLMTLAASCLFKNFLKYSFLQMPWRRINSWEVLDDIKLVSCDISEEEFSEKFIRTSTPVIFENCDYSWLDEYDVSPMGATLVINQVLKRVFFRQSALIFRLQMYHDNKTTPKLDHIFLPRPGFTHVQTPNSDYDDDDVVLEGFGKIFSAKKEILYP